MKKITQIFAFLFITMSLSAHEFDIISGMNVETDYIKDGVKGINITYRYNFLPLEEYDHNDTILEKANFSIKTTFTEGGNDVEVAEGFKSVSNDNGNAEFSIIFTVSEMEASKFDKKIYQFIPYAALKLSEGKHTISAKALFSGRDGTDKYHEQTKEVKDISFKKPATKIFTMNIDYIEVNTLNSSNKAWDYSIFKTDAPDIGVNILIGNTTVWKSSVNDTYMFAVGPNSKNIKFTISEKDKVAVLVQDIDVIFHDFIAKWIFTTADKKNGILYTYDKAKGNIKSCSLNFKIN